MYNLGGTFHYSLLNDLKESIQGEHASNLGAIIANEITASINKPEEEVKEYK